jgi:hypothetical protein
MAYTPIYTANTNVMNPFGPQKSGPLDVRGVVNLVSDLKEMAFLKSAYVGMIVYVVDDQSLYVCYNKPKTNKLTNIEDGWHKIDYTTRIVEFESNLTDGTTILFPYQGMMVYVTSEDSLYILLTKGVENAKDINNWKKISATSSASLADKVGINVAPEGGSGFKITENKDVIIEDYVNVENYIKAGYNYTSKGVNSFDADSNFIYDSVKLSKGGDSYIELYANGDNWMMVNDEDNSLGLSELSGKTFAKETFVCFGVDIQFTDGWTISYGEESRLFEDSDYDLIDIYRSENAPEVYAYLEGEEVRMLTEDDLVAIDDKIDNLAHSIMIEMSDVPSEPGESDDSDSELPGESDGGSTDVPKTVTLHQAITQINNSINEIKQEVTEVVEPDTIGEEDIKTLF